jgi:hypothetical protein
LIRAGRLEEAAEVALAGRDPVRRVGLQGYWQETFLLLNAAEAFLELGRWDDAEELLLAVPQHEGGGAAVASQEWCKRLGAQVLG